MIFSMILLFVLQLVFINYVKPEDNSTLVLLQIVHRHGDRTPIDLYPNDPYIGDKWLDELGQLTPRGKRRMFEFGHELRKRYGNYLGDSPKNIYIRSSASDRCIESAQALVAGLYPPKDRWIWSNNLVSEFWQPIAVQTVLKSTDGLLVPSSDCPAADAAYEQVMHSKEVQDFMDSQKDFIKVVELKSGKKLITLRDVDWLADSIKAEISFDEPKPVPKWIQDLGNDTLERLEYFETMAFKYDWSSKIVQRLRAGLILKELTDNMINAMKGQKNMKKVYSYSTHDTLVVVLLQALGLYSGIPPTYGATLLFELHKINGQYIIHLYYANLTPNLSYKRLELNNCRLDNKTENSCELNTFVDNVKQFIPNDWHKECQLNGSQVLYSMESIDTDDTHETDGSEYKIVGNKCLGDNGNILLIIVGFICGILTVFIYKLIKVLIENLMPPNGKRFAENSYSVNNSFKNNLDRIGIDKC